MSTVTSLCHCWKLTRTDGVASRHTDHDAALVVGGETYEPLSGFSASEVRDTLGMAIDMAEVEGALSSDSISEADIFAGLYDGATLETLLVNWRDTSQYSLLRKAGIGTIKRIDGRFVAELQSATSNLDLRQGRLMRRLCDAELGDARCGMNIGTPTYTGTGAVATTEVNGGFIVSGLDGYADGWFGQGMLTWTSGALAGRKVRVVSHRNTALGISLSVWSEVDAVPKAGDGFTVTAGCDKRFSTCRFKYGNQLRFRGFPHMPGNDAAYSYVTDGVVFDGGAVVP
jgi:uncharacterized phage protein (TIGR02218 family)